MGRSGPTMVNANRSAPSSANQSACTSGWPPAPRRCAITTSNRKTVRLYGRIAKDFACQSRFAIALFMLQNVGPIFLVVVFMFSAIARAAVPRRSLSDEQIVAQGQLVASGTNVEIYQHGAVIDPSFLRVMESAHEKVGKVTVLRLDTATLGPTVRVYVSDAIGVSHVSKGYQHQSDPKAIIFLNPRVYQGALSGKNATHVHELTHLFTWRYHSHTL